jgi:Flavodoxin
MQDLNLKDKKVAVFGLGDSISYSDNYADATGELHDVFQRLGANMLGYTSQEGYEHKSSKAIREDLFCGLLLDAVNQEELSQDRVEGWVQQLLEEGILEGSTASNGAEAAAPSVTPLVIPATVSTVVNGDGDIHALIAKLEQENAALRKKLEDNSSLLEESMHDGFIPHVNARTGRTMWVSPNGRACYYTERKASIKVSP